MFYSFLRRHALAATLLVVPLCGYANSAEYSELGFREGGQHSHDHSRCTHPALAPAFGAGSKYNLDFSLIGSFAAGGSSGDPKKLQLGGHDPVNEGFNLQSLELVVRGSFGPYFNGLAVVLAGVDADDDPFVELEEAWVETTSLPYGLSLRGGQLMTQFGLFNPTHLHQWAFVDSTLVNARLLGEDGLRGPGGQVSWKVPVPFDSEFIFGAQKIQNDHDHGEPAGHDHAEGLIEGPLYTGRYVQSHQLTKTQTVAGGFSAALGSNDSGDDYQSTLMGLDLSWKWMPTDAAFPFVSWRGEVIWRKAEIALGSHDEGEHEGEHEEDGHAADGRFDDWGLYSQLLWGIKSGWIAGVRADYVQEETLVDGDERWRVSPSLTWIPNDSCKVRLQYNYDQSQEEGGDHSVWLQFAFFLGAHKAH